MRTKRIAVGIITALALAIPAGTSFAQEEPIGDPTGIVASDNVTVHTVLPEPSAIGARFRGDLMFLTSFAGLTVYDVSTPTAPEEIGRLPLPHFENEDVDLGGDILLISNDAAESRGILHVIDISDPTNPTQLAMHDMAGDPTGLTGGAPGHTASCILDCTFAWVTDSGGMRVIDLTDPANPVNLGTFSTPAAGDLGITHDVQVGDDGVAWISGYGGLTGYRVDEGYAAGVQAASPGGRDAMDEFHASLFYAGTGDAAHSTYGDFESEEALGLGPGATYNDFIIHNSRRLGSSEIVYVTEEDYTRPGCRGAGSFETWRIPLEEEDENLNGVLDPTGEQMEPLDKWETELLADTAQPAAMCSAHYFDVRSNVVAQAWYEQGLRLLDVSDPTNIRQIGFFYTPVALSWASYFPPTDPTGRVVYLLDATMGLVVLEYDRPTEGPLAISEEGDDDEGDDDDDGDDDGGGTQIGGGGSDNGGNDAEVKKKKKKKSCKAKKTKKAKKKCKKKKQKQQQRRAAHPESGSGSGEAASPAEASEPTVRAPILASWTTGASKGTPSTSFGFACRFIL